MVNVERDSSFGGWIINHLLTATAIRASLVVMLLFFSVSCGGGGGGGGGSGETTSTSNESPTTTTVPVLAQAGSDHTIVLGRYVLLDGSESTGSGSLTYEWTIAQSPSGSTAVPANNSATPTFIPDAVGDYTIRLTVTDSQGQTSEPDEVTIHVLSASSSVHATLAWDAGSSQVEGYKVYYGTRSGTYHYVEDVGNITTCTVSNLTAGVRYYFAVTAYAAGSESGFSNEVSFIGPV